MPTSRPTNSTAGTPAAPSRRDCLIGGLGLAVGVVAADASWAAGDTEAPNSVWRIADDRLVLSNGTVSRTIRLPTAAAPAIATLDFRTVAQPSRYFTGHDGKFIADPDEFAFRANGVAHSGRHGWALRSITDAGDPLQGRGADVTLHHETKGIEVILQYLLYPGLPVVRKRLTVRNLGSKPIKLEDIDVESFALEQYWPGTTSWVHSDYGRRKSLIPFEGGRQDALVALHNPDWEEGLVLGNEAAGVNKYCAAFADGATFRAGLARRDSDTPFAKWIEPGASYAAPRAFAIVYAGQPRFEQVLNTAVPDFVRRHMGIRLSKLRVKPRFVYNTWEPFKNRIDEKLLMELATAAAAAGVKEFVIDDGWQSNYGDWAVDHAKFPRGLKPVIDHIRSLGMKPGIWVSIGSADRTSAVYRAHPEWFARDVGGKHYSMQGGDSEYVTACFGTGWRDHISRVLLDLIEANGLEYLKLDFAVVSSPYEYDAAKTGCYATNHDHHDHAESLSVGFDLMWQVFDGLHAAHPEIFIDCTFEAMGGLQLVDYAMLQHAEGNWLSNYTQPDAADDLRIRNMAWWRSPAIPATALVIGNAKLDDKGYELHLKSLAGALPIMLGDPRALSVARRARCRAHADWLELMASRHDIFSYRQDLAGFGEPQAGSWDGFQRINTESRSGGIVGIFRHDATEDSRRITIGGLDPIGGYAVRTMDGVHVASATGRNLAEHGFEWRLVGRIDGTLFEVCRSSSARARH